MQQKLSLKQTNKTIESTDIQVYSRSMSVFSVFKCLNAITIYLHSYRANIHTHPYGKNNADDNNITANA